MNDRKRLSKLNRLDSFEIVRMYLCKLKEKLRTNKQFKIYQELRRIIH